MGFTVVGKIFGEMLIRTLSTTLLQVSYKFIKEPDNFYLIINYRHSNISGAY